MPVSRDTAWVEKSVSEEVFEENWKRGFGKVSPRPEINNKKPWCTCNHREVKIDGKIVIVRDDCETHGQGNSKEVKVTDLAQKFPKRHIDKVKNYAIYGNGDLREITRRKT